MNLEKVDLLTEIDSVRRGWQACETRLAAVEAERDAARAEVERLKGHEDRARWCEENYANVFWQVSGQYWFCEVPQSPKAFTQYFREATRSAAIDAARGVK